MAKVTVQYATATVTHPREMSVEMSPASANLIASLAIKLALLDEVYDPQATQYRGQG